MRRRIVNPEQEFVPEKLDYPTHKCPNCGSRGLYIYEITGTEEEEWKEMNRIIVWQVMQLRCPACGHQERHARVLPPKRKD